MIYTEKQYFRQGWVWIPMTIAVLIPTFLVLFADKTDGEIPTPWIYLIVPGIPLLIMAMFYFTHLDVEITGQYIKYRFVPFHRRERMIYWTEIQRAYVRKYDPIGEYGGWGIKGGGWWKKGRAYNVSGNKGLQLELSNGKKLLLGTKNEAALKEFLRKLKEDKPKLNIET